MRRFPVTLYKEQWLKLLDMAAEIRAFIAANESQLKAKEYTALVKLGLEGIMSKRKDSMYRSGRSPDWLKMKNLAAPTVKREAEEDWGKRGRR